MEVVLRRQLELLYKIQTIDTNIRNSKELQRNYHKKIKRLKEELESEKDRNKSEQENLEGLEKKYRDMERALNILEDQKKKIQDKTLSIKTNKEYQAALQEIETIKDSISRKEDEVIEIIENIESTKKLLKKSEGDLGQKKIEYEEEKKQIEEELKNHLADIETQKEKRDLLIKEIDPNVFADYQRIENVRQGFAVALTENEQCLGCSMKIPPQIYNEVVLAEKIITCPYCHRILYVNHNKDKKQE